MVGLGTSLVVALTRSAHSQLLRMGRVGRLERGSEAGTFCELEVLVVPFLETLASEPRESLSHSCLGHSILRRLQWPQVPGPRDSVH
jgi:hypothetical protein